MELVNLSTTAAPLPRRLATVKALDLATDGGPVLGSSILLAGAPGAGKSTLLLQTAAEAADAIYVTGEETTGMLALRALRLALAHGSGILAAACTKDSFFTLARHAGLDDSDECLHVATH